MSEQTVLRGSLAENKSENYKEFYSNFSRVGVSAWDLAIAFGLLNDTSEGSPSVTMETLVRMSPQQFKAFATSLPLILAEWESRFGEIHLAPGLLVSAETMHQAMASSGFPTPVSEPQAAANKGRSAPKRRS